MVSGRLLVLMLAALATSSCIAGSVAAVGLNGGEFQRVANLERAAKYPWVDEGACAVREAAGDWRTLVERCYFALDLSRIQFRDIDHRCPVAQADTAMVGQMVGICLLVQPELIVGAVVVVGVVVVAAAIAAELDKKLPCRCLCFSVDDLGVRYGPGREGRTKDKFKCEERCVQRGYNGGGRCAE